MSVFHGRDLFASAFNHRFSLIRKPIEEVDSVLCTLVHKVLVVVPRDTSAAISNERQNVHEIVVQSVFAQIGTILVCDAKGLRGYCIALLSHLRENQIKESKS